MASQSNSKRVLSEEGRITRVDIESSGVMGRSLGDLAEFLGVPFSSDGIPLLSIMVNATSGGAHDFLHITYRRNGDQPTEIPVI